MSNLNAAFGEWHVRVPEPLAAQHRLDGFDCGRPALNDWLLRHARQAQGSGPARTFVVAEGVGRVAGYFSLTVGQVDTLEAPERVRNGMGQYPLPVVILARLAVPAADQGRRIGFGLLLLAGLLAAFPGFAPAAPPAADDTTVIREQYVADRDRCMTIEDAAQRGICLREAAEAAQAARRGALSEEVTPDYQANALVRCHVLPPDQRAACILRMQGAGAVRGSVEAGGLYRELRLPDDGSALPDPQNRVAPATTIVAPPPAPASVVVPR